MRTLIAIACISLLAWGGCNGACGGGNGAAGADSGVNDDANGDSGSNNNDGGADDDGATPYCGDGVTDEATGEECDDGADNSDAPNAWCRTDCLPRRCGDGILDAADGCDDGNLDDGDGCSATCEYEVTCGSMSVDGVALAMDEIYLGDTDWQSLPSANAWELFGKDLDGLTTTSTDTTGHCVANAGASPATVFPDGPVGLDNSFGRNVMPLLATVIPNLSQQTNAVIDGGQYTLLMLIEPILSPNMTGVYANLYGGAPLPAAPLWNGTDCWPVLREDLTDPNNITTAVMQFTDSTVTNDLWESGPGAGATITLTLRLNLGSIVLPLTLREARLELQLSSGYTAGTDGIITGVIDTEELVELLRDALGSTDPSLCQGSTFDALALQVRQTSDIMVDGTQDPTATCNAISVGLGFTMSEVRLGQIAPAAVQPVDPCP